MTSSDSARSIYIYVLIPCLAGMTTRWVGIKVRGRGWYESTFVPRISPVTLVALRFTIVVMFSLQGEAILDRPFAAVRIAVPVLSYSGGMVFAAFGPSGKAGADYRQPPTPAFTAASHTLERAR